MCIFLLMSDPEFESSSTEKHNINILYPGMTRIPLFFSKAGKEKADVSVRLLKEMMETSRAKQGKHYFKEQCKWKKTKKKKTKRANKIDTIRYQTSEFLIERRGFFYCAKYAEIIYFFFVQSMLNFQFPFFQSALNTYSIFVYSSLPCSRPCQLTSVQPLINPIMP